jgi:phospholipid/cholesterol/gamma-HCH transport system substrate-binding protein
MRRAAAVGALGAAVAAVALVWAPWRDGGTRVIAVFDQVPGLVQGAEVRAGGIQVGTVERIRLVDDLPHVTLRLQPGYRLRRGATADLRLASLAGEANRFVAVGAGGGPLLRDGATLGVARTDQPVEVDQVLSTLDPATRRDVRGVLRGLAASLRGRGDDVALALRRSARALRGTADALGEVDADGGALRTLVRTSARLTAVLDGDTGAAPAAAESLARLLGTTAARQEALAAAVRALPAGLRAPRRALARLHASTGDLRALVAALGPGARALRAQAPRLRGLLVAARPVLADARGLTATAPSGLRRLGALLPTARRLLPRLGSALGQANPMLDDTRVRTPDFFSFFANWADFTSDYDANGHAARVGLVFPPAPLNQVGGDANGAGHLTAPFLRTPGAVNGEPWRDYRDSFVGSAG